MLIMYVSNGSLLLCQNAGTLRQCRITALSKLASDASGSRQTRSTSTLVPEKHSYRFLLTIVQTKQPTHQHIHNGLHFAIPGQWL